MTIKSPASDNAKTHIEVSPFRASSSLIRIEVDAVSHRGHVRTTNEDQFYVARLERSLITMLSGLPTGEVPDRAEEVNYVLAVADGMGGHAAGEVASRLAISTLINRFLDVPDWIFKLDRSRADLVERRARKLVEDVGSVLMDRAHEDAALRGMGTTLTVARSYGQELLVVHVGDSRAYLFRGGQLHRLTKDHTYAQLLVDTGRLQASDVATSGVRHILMNALGGTTDHVEVDIDLLRLEDGDRLLLCSDGLTDPVTDETVAQTLATTTSPGECCRQLLQLALDAGGKDNITLIVASYSIPDTPRASS